MKLMTLRLVAFAILTVLCMGTVAQCADAAPATAPDTSAPAVADPAHYLAAIVTLLHTDWPKNRTVNFVCHGHSVPAGYFHTPEVHTMEAYPHLWHAKLAAAFPHAVANVIVTAIGGENAESGARRFARDVLSLHPDVVTIDYALNDRHIGLPRARAAWETMIQQALAAKAKVILLTPTGDTSAKLDDPNDPLNQHARQIRELAAQYHVGLVDSLEQFVRHVKGGGLLTDLMSQVNHPNAKGHELVATELMRWLP